MAKRKKPCCRAEKVHYVTPAVFEQTVPLPALCGSTRAKHVTVDQDDVTCVPCKRKLKQSEG